MVQLFKVSVIIPVYNAEKYLRKAVESAIVLDEVGEIVLVEDKSPDNALELCVALEKEYDKVKLYQHPDKCNHGAGASRNLGIQKSNCDYIAFLDADDYYLPTRFKKDQDVFARYPDCDGVYSSVETYFYSEEAKRNFFDNGFGYQEILSLNAAVPPEELFSVLFSKHPSVTGQFCTNGITLKREVFNTVGMFNINLKLKQDIHLWRRLAGFCNLYPGDIKQPVAFRGIHSQNRMTRVKDHEQYVDLWWKSLKVEFQKRQLNSEKYAIFEQCYSNHYVSSGNKIVAFKTFLINVFKYPKIVKESYGDFDFNFWKVFGRNKLTLSAISFKNKVFKSKN